MPKNFIKAAVAALADEQKQISVSSKVRGENRGESSRARPQGRGVKKINDTAYTKELDFETLDLRKIQIMFMAEEELGKISVNVTREQRDEIYRETIADPRMFPQRNQLCSTCELPGNFCPGHLGRINLEYPLINEWGKSYLMSILRTICYKCGTLLPDIETVDRMVRTADHLKKVADLAVSKNLTCRNRACRNYGKPNPTFKAASFAKLFLKFPDDSSEYMMTPQIINVLENMSVEELEALKFPQSGKYKVHPKNMLFTYLAVIPENHRPPMKTEAKIVPNSLTSNYTNIIKINNALKEGGFDDQKGIDSLDSEVSSILFREKEGTGPGGSIDTSKNIKDLISKKRGLIRSNIQAKRCDRTGRTVIGPGGLDIPFGYIRIPEAMQKILLRELVCDSNREYYQSRMEEMKYFVEIDGKLTNTSFIKNFQLKNGMILYRPLQNGDPILANRNPTLHKHSMMGYRVKIKPGLSVGLHSSNTTHHNADFDGDEINLGAPPGYKARAEIYYMAGCWNHIIGSQFSRPMMGLVFNGTTGAYLISRYGEVSDKMWNTVTLDIYDRENRMRDLKERYMKAYPDANNWKTGKSLFSLLLPENFYYNHDKVKIVNGIMVEGELTKSHVGPSTSAITHQIFNTYGQHYAARFIDEGQALADRFLEYVGFTVGYRDCAMPNEESRVQEIVEKQIAEAEGKIMELAPLMSNKYEEIREFYNQSVQAALDTVKQLGQEIIKDALDDSNALKIMANSGAKGKAADVAQVIGVVGQQFVKGQRPDLHYNKKPNGEGRRFLPHYDIQHEGYSEKIRNRGFVDRALGKGMRPGQLNAHMIPSRDGLIDTALGTASTGYTHHTITQAFEDLRCGYNGTICDDLGRITQYSPGYDSYDPVHVVEVHIPGYGKTWSPFDIPNIVEMLNASE